MMARALPLVLYSTNTWLAYMIARHYYGDRHYVWCAPAFNAARLQALGYAVPPSSCPDHIYRTYLDDVTKGDHHSNAVRFNKAGIRRGILAKRAAGVISDGVAKDLMGIVKAADIRDFRPLLFVIPYPAVESIARLAPVGSRANPFACEYQLPDLPGSLFDVAEFLGEVHV